jgi:hypothetical protein
MAADTGMYLLNTHSMVHKILIVVIASIYMLVRSDDDCRVCMYRDCIGHHIEHASHASDGHV